jgi:hypothetical protein
LDVSTGVNSSTAKAAEIACKADAGGAMVAVCSFWDMVLYKAASSNALAILLHADGGGVTSKSSILC